MFVFPISETDEELTQTIFVLLINYTIVEVVVSDYRPLKLYVTFLGVSFFPSVSCQIEFDLLCATSRLNTKYIKICSSHVLFPTRRRFQLEF